MLIIYYCQTLFGQQNGYESVKHISKLSFKNYISSVHLTVKIMKQNSNLDAKYESEKVIKKGA